VGRGDQNQVVIEHPSISSSHCRLTVSETHAVLRDCGSTGGTFVRGELVEEARLVPGSVFRLGEVQFRFESDAPGGSEPPMPPPLRRPAVSLGTAPRHCKYHPQTRARFHCSRCKLSFCDLCVERRVASGGSASVRCRKCGMACDPVADAPVVTGPPPAFASMLPGAFLYPWKGNGFILLVGGAVFFLLLSFLPLVGLLITGYLFSYAKRIVAASANGEAAPPDWPDFTNWVDDILVPYFHLIALVALTFGPAWVIAVFLPATTPYYWALVIATTVAGAFLAPMGMLALAMFDTVTALNPMTLIWSIQRIPWHYLVAAIAFESVIGAYVFCEAFVGKVVPIPFLGSLVAGCLNLYLLAVAMRILGLLYWSKKEELGWFSR
jgi:hypothetical protein